MHYKIHRLVALTYLLNPCNKPDVNHKDGNKQYNHVSNLEWITKSENHQHAWDTGLHYREQKFYKILCLIDNQEVGFTVCIKDYQNDSNSDLQQLLLNYITEELSTENVQIIGCFKNQFYEQDYGGFVLIIPYPNLY